MRKYYVIKFYFSEFDDLGIPDVHWSGGIFEARDWARKRLELVGGEGRGAHELGPQHCALCDSQGDEICEVSLDGSSGQEAGRWHRPR